MYVAQYDRCQSEGCKMLLGGVYIRIKVAKCVLICLQVFTINNHFNITGEKNRYDSIQEHMSRYDICLEADLCETGLEVDKSREICQSPLLVKTPLFLTVVRVMPFK